MRGVSGCRTITTATSGSLKDRRNVIFFFFFREGKGVGTEIQVFLTPKVTGLGEERAREYPQLDLLQGEIPLFSNRYCV